MKGNPSLTTIELMILSDALWSEVPYFPMYSGEARCLLAGASYTLRFHPYSMLKQALKFFTTADYLHFYADILSNL
eukprot:g76496.t1